MQWVVFDAIRVALTALIVDEFHLEGSHLSNGLTPLVPVGDFA